MVTVRTSKTLESGWAGRLRRGFGARRYGGPHVLDAQAAPRIVAWRGRHRRQDGRRVFSFGCFGHASEIDGSVTAAKVQPGVHRDRGPFRVARVTQSEAFVTVGVVAGLLDD